MTTLYIFLLKISAFFSCTELSESTIVGIQKQMVGCLVLDCRFESNSAQRR